MENLKTWISENAVDWAIQIGIAIAIFIIGKMIARMLAGLVRKGMTRAGTSTLGKGYDKLLKSRVADMKNIGGRLAGSITAAQFLQRFVRDTPWVHLDVAGVAMASGKTDISRTWASGWGVRLLNELVASKYEK